MVLHAAACHGHLQSLHPARSDSTWSCMLGCWCCAFRCRDQPEIPLQEAESFSSWLSVVLAGRWHGTLRAGSSLKSLFRRQKVFPLPAPSRQVALCASLGPPCPLRLLTLFPIVCVWHRVTLCTQGWAEEFIFVVCPFKNHCLFKTANCHAGNSSASRPMKTQCFCSPCIGAHVVVCRTPYFLWDISRRNFHWVPSRQIHEAFHIYQTPKAFEHSDTAAGLSCGGISIFRKFLRKVAEEFRSQTIAWHTETTSGENERHKGAVFSQCP